MSAHNRLHACLATLLLACLFVPAHALREQTDDSVMREYLWNRFLDLPADQRPKIGLALSAGGVRGFAHVGVLEVFDNAGLPVNVMSGTSMGAVVGSLYGAGLPIPKLWELSEHMHMGNITADYNVMGLLRLLFFQKLPTSSNLEKFLNEQIGEMTFEDMKIPFTTAAMDVKTGERVVFNSGPLSIAVRASMNLPGVFQPVEYRQRYLVDGAVVDYLPVETVRQMGADYVIASVTPLDFSSNMPQSIAAYLLRVGDVRGAAMIEESAKKADFVLTNHVPDIGTLELDKLHDAGEVGVREAYQQLDALQDDILLRTLPNVLQP